MNALNVEHVHYVRDKVAGVDIEYWMTEEQIQQNDKLIRSENAPTIPIWTPPAASSAGHAAISAVSARGADAWSSDEESTPPRVPDASLPAVGTVIASALSPDTLGLMPKPVAEVPPSQLAAPASQPAGLPLLSVDSSHLSCPLNAPPPPAAMRLSTSVPAPPAASAPSPPAAMANPPPTAEAKAAPPPPPSAKPPTESDVEQPTATMKQAIDALQMGNGAKIMKKAMPLYEWTLYPPGTDRKPRYVYTRKAPPAGAAPPHAPYADSTCTGENFRGTRGAPVSRD